MKTACGLPMVCGWLLAASLAHAQGPRVTAENSSARVQRSAVRRLSLVLARPDDLDLRLSTELTVANFSVRRAMLPSGGADGPPELAAIARQDQSSWLVHLRADRIDLWSTRDGRLAFVDTFMRGTEDDVALVRVVERVRSADGSDTGAPIREALAQPSAASFADPATDAAARVDAAGGSRTIPRLRIASGIGFRTSAKAGTATTFRGELGTTIAAHLSIAARASIPLSETMLAGPGGAAALRAYGFDGRLAYAFERIGLVTPFVGIGGGAWLMHAQGQAVAPNTSDQGSLWVPAATVAAGASVPLSRVFAMRVEADASTLLAPARLRFLGNPSEVGPLSVSGSLMLEVALIER